MVKKIQEHGGGIDAAARRFGGARRDWIDLSTGINPVAYPIGQLAQDAWTALPDHAAQTALLDAARDFWQVPEGAAILATPGASAPIAMIPRLRRAGRVHIAAPTYNEHAAAFSAAGWHVADSTPETQIADAQVIVHPNNPDGRIFSAQDLNAPLRVVDESFCDVMPDASLIAQAGRTDTLILKSFGKFWGLAGLRLGFVIGAPALIEELAQMLGPWPVSGPALTIGTAALNDLHWAHNTRQRLTDDAARLDAAMKQAGAKTVGGTSLFRLYDVPDAAGWQTRLARHHVWSRTFSYNPRWLRLGLPAPDAWGRIGSAIKAPE
ncbi:threonine-phosphate decarboxylase CobD [uncultured Sulfitobacter sp.]|uniref:threonine-phosphate decarboxylase CobD n=1 Tax=uncultured Sulfitobacter sp. TaxID=191468 RepID=UPI002605BFED|nr:threonine-phosphate decarboxylase CobD [uncultured Sulfitobacter sp.]